MKPNLEPAVFLNLEGTIIADRGRPNPPADGASHAEAARTLQRLQGVCRLLILAPPPGAAGDPAHADDTAGLREQTVAHLRRHGVVIDGICGGSGSHPPHPAVESAARQYGVDLTRSFIVGTKPQDLALAGRTGATGVYVRTRRDAHPLAVGHGCRAVVPGLHEAVDWILACGAMRTLEASHPDALPRAADTLRHGGLVAFPTETVYGLGADAFNERAVARVFEVKQRPHFDPLIVHVSGPEQLPLLVENPPAAAFTLIEQFWPGPLTIVLPKSSRVPDLVTAGLETVAVRMPRHPLALELILRAGTPIAAPSANPFGYVSPTTAAHVARHLGAGIDMVLDGGPCTVGVESTVLSLAEARPVILRAGGITREELEQALGCPVDSRTSSDRPAAPGQTPRHYSPRTPIVLGGGGGGAPAGKRVGLLCYRPHASTGGFAAVEVLTRDGDLREAAINLFAALHRLDAQGLDLIVADTVPDTGVGVAIMDRLSRACAAPDAAGYASPPGLGRPD